MITDKQIQTIADHFIAAAIWADAPEGTNPRCGKQTRDKIISLCEYFTDKNEALFIEAIECEDYGSHPDVGSPEAAFGHDLYLTLMGHGVGFWDRKELKENELGDRITQACKDFGYFDVHFSCGWLYVEASALKAAA